MQQIEPDHKDFLGRVYSEPNDHSSGHPHSPPAPITIGYVTIVPYACVPTREIFPLYHWASS